MLGDAPMASGGLARGVSPAARRPIEPPRRFSGPFFLQRPGKELMAQLATTYRVMEPYLLAKDGSYALPLAVGDGLHPTGAHRRAGSLVALSTRLEYLRSTLPPLFFTRR